MNEDVELARTVCNLRFQLTSFIHDLLCFDQSCLDGSGQLQQWNDYTLELLYVKNQSLPTKLFIPQLAPDELAKRVIADHDLISCILQSFLDSLTALQNPLHAATVTTGTCSKSFKLWCTTCLQCSLVNCCLKVCPLITFTIDSFMPSSISLTNPSLVELQTQFIVLLTEIIKWSWMLGLDPHLPSSIQSDLLKERLFTANDLNLPTLKLNARLYVVSSLMVILPWLLPKYNLRIQNRCSPD